MRGGIPLFPQCVIVAWCLVKLRDNVIYFAILEAEGCKGRPLLVGSGAMRSKVDATHVRDICSIPC